VRNIMRIARQLGPIAAAAILLSVSGIARSDQAGEEPSIQVSGEGTVKLAPDLALLQLTVRREAQTAGAARHLAIQQDTVAEYLGAQFAG
jgi:uncharacterized protein YggE